MLKSNSEGDGSITVNVTGSTGFNWLMTEAKVELL
jgi:hypothetical protein